MMKKKKILVVFLLLLVIIPLLIYVAKTQQAPPQEIAPKENRSASTPTSGPVIETEVILKLSKDTQGTPVTQLTLIPNQKITLFLYLDTQGVNVNGFDVTIQSDNNLKLTNIAEGDDAAKFDTLVFNDLSKGRLTKITLNTTPIVGNIHLATLTFVAQAKGTGIVKAQKATITSLESSKSLHVFLPTISYIVK